MLIPSSDLQNALTSQPLDMKAVVRALLDYLLLDPKFKTNDFETAIAYVLTTGGIKEEALFEKFDPEFDMVDNESLWDEAYYRKARTFLETNFCRERVIHVREVARKLYPIKDDTAATTSEVGNGGQSSKKAKRRQDQGKISMEQKNVKILILIVLISIVLLASIIVFIMKR